MKPLVLAFSAACLALAIAACGGGGAESAGPVPNVPIEAEPAAASPAGSEQPGLLETRPVETFEVWFVRDAGSIVGENGTEIALGPRLFSTSRTAKELATMASAAGIPADIIFYGIRPLQVTPTFALGNGHEWVLFEALRAGPSPDEAAAGVTSAIPAEAKPLGDVCCGGGTASTYDLPSEFESGGSSLSLRLRLAQVVFTMTQAGGAPALRLSIDGQPVDVLSKDGTVLDGPVTRKDFEDLLPPITVKAPTIGSEVASPVRIAGNADVFAADMKARVLDAAGSVLAEGLATVDRGTVPRGVYGIEIPFEVSEPQPGAIQLQGDFAAESLVEIPVTLVP